MFKMLKSLNFVEFRILKTEIGLSLKIIHTPTIHTIIHAPTKLATHYIAILQISFV